MHTAADLRDQFLAYLEANTFDQEPNALYAPVNYIMNMGGKRLRPLLALLACQLFSDETKAALPAAMAVEIFHNFSLVHDDIMDEAPLRRGRPTVHEQFGLNAGILSGDVMLIHAYAFLMKSPHKPTIGGMVQVLNKVAIKVCEGQQYDIDFETRSDVSLAEYLKMIELKTAALLAGSLELGALAAGAPAVDQQHLAEFGRLTGIAFQLQDDFLDTFGDPEKVGKRPGGDIVQNKKTCLIIKALELADPTTRQKLEALYSSTTIDAEQKVKEVIHLFNQLGIPDFVRDLRNDYQERAYQHLEAVEAPQERKKLLQELADSLLIREM